MSNSKKPSRYVLSAPRDAGRVLGSGADIFPRVREPRRVLISSHPHAATGNDPPPERRINVGECRRREASSSFLPHPDIMRQYGEIIVDAPERILRILEADSAHVRERQLNIFTAKVRDVRRIHWMTYSFIAGGYGMALIFAVMNRDVLAGIVLTTTIIGTVTTFMKQRHDRATDVLENDTPSE